MHDLLSQMPLIVPAAGESARFKAVTSRPKGLIKFDFEGETSTMIQHCTAGWAAHRVIVACRSEDYDAFSERLFDETVEIVVSSRGQADTVRRAIGLGGVVGPFLVLNSDNAFRPRSVLRTFAETCLESGAVAGAITMLVDEKEAHRYSFVDQHPLFSHCAEKRAISRFAMAGSYYFASSVDYMRAFDDMSGTCEGEVYLSSLFQFLRTGERLSFVVPRTSLHEWGIPSDLENDRAVTNIRW